VSATVPERPRPFPSSGRGVPRPSAPTGAGIEPQRHDAWWNAPHSRRCRGTPPVHVFAVGATRASPVRAGTGGDLVRFPGPLGPRVRHAWPVESRTRDPYRDGGGRSRGGGWYACHHRKPVPPGRGDARSARYDTPHPRRCRGTSSPARCGRGGQACRADPRRESRLCDRCPLYRSCRGEPCLAHPRRTARE